MKQPTTKQNTFIEQSTIKHANQYNYTKVCYVNVHTKVIIICSTHGEFTQTPAAHVRGSGCPICAKQTRYNTKLMLYGSQNNIQQIIKTNLNKYGVHSTAMLPDVREKQRLTHNKRYGVDYFSQREDIKLKIKTDCISKYGVTNHGKRADVRLKYRETCMEKYGVDNTSKIQEIKDKIRNTNNQKYNGGWYNQQHMIENVILLQSYDWLFNQYIICQKTAALIAIEQNTTTPTVIRYLRQADIEIRQTNKFSILCIKWLDEIQKNEQILIQHALNGGEYKIPNTRYTADGYCKDTNTIYEFYGDIWHGNPIVFESTSQCHPYNNLTAGELFQQTITRENTLKELGYNVIAIWESQWFALET